MVAGVPNLGFNSNLLGNGNNLAAFSFQSSNNAYADDILMKTIDFKSPSLGASQNAQSQKSVQPQQPKQVAAQNVAATPVPVGQPVAKAQAAQTFVGQSVQAAPQNVQTAQQSVQPAPQNVQASQPVEQDPLASPELVNYLVDKGEKPSRFGAALGTVAGLTLPLVRNKYVLGKFLSKDLLLKCPILGATGFALGLIVDGLFGNKSAKKSEAQQVEAQEIGRAHV